MFGKKASSLTVSRTNQGLNWQGSRLPKGPKLWRGGGERERQREREREREREGERGTEGKGDGGGEATSSQSHVSCHS